MYDLQDYLEDNKNCIHTQSSQSMTHNYHDMLNIKNLNLRTQRLSLTTNELTGSHQMSQVLLFDLLNSG
jgi:hypothetical protein